MSNKQNIPSLRFAEFNGVWEEKPFKELVKINQGLQIAISERLTKKEEGALFYITNEVLRGNTGKEYYIKNAPKSVICNKHDILMTRTGNTGKVVTNIEGAFHNNFFRIAYPKSIVKDFLVNYLNLRSTQNYILRLAGTSTIPDLNHSDFYKIKFTYPNESEQQKIATFLTAVDSKIKLLQNKKQGLAQYKKGVMQQIFTQNLRFKDDKGNNYPDWEEKKLGEVCEIKGRIGYRGYTVKDIVKKGEGAITLSPSNVSNGKLNYDNSTYISWFKYDESPEIKVEINDTLLVKTASVGKSAFVEYLQEPATINPQFVILKNTSLYPKFLAYSIYHTDIQRQIVEAVGSGAVPNLSQDSISKFNLKIPSKEEQTQIANFLSAIDNKIALVNTQLENTQQFKKGLLQQMFV